MKLTCLIIHSMIKYVCIKYINLESKLYRITHVTHLRWTGRKSISFFWLKVCVSFLPRSPGVSFHKRTKLFLMLFFKLWNMADFLAENRKLLSSALTGPLLYLYFLYGSSSKFWTVKLRRKNLISDIHKKKWNI